MACQTCDLITKLFTRNDELTARVERLKADLVDCTANSTYNANEAKRQGALKLEAQANAQAQFEKIAALQQVVKRSTERVEVLQKQVKEWRKTVAELEAKLNKQK